MRASVAPHRFGPLYISKINTLIQIALVGFVLARLGLGAQAGSAEALLIAAAAVTTVLSGLSYLVRWARIIVRFGTGAREPAGLSSAVLGRPLSCWSSVALGLVQSILMPFAVGFALAYVLAPAVARLERWGVRRTLASLCRPDRVPARPVADPGHPGAADPGPGRPADREHAEPRRACCRTSSANLIELLQQHLPAEDVSKLRDMLGAKMAEALTWLAGCCRA